ncbi:putative bifunctional diguanylate cyclase/phosphodiesterase [Cellulomonas marina]|uniref:Diguanylate cyclase (GGDEF) domain-containing protein n=1 Tax=Cellulomonas marina TaxID=988821 RepID=A0A1I0ZC05_9CELL|nr:EAL domain-containing protein [Cellulomonas marina]GIG29021.1 GGDEF-domain containing protein [Cellulomonas marina]SFB22080.1 diguanylate cyclase (GGDEF) domain-containing protein [Cellulomonas marina]
MRGNRGVTVAALAVGAGFAVLVLLRPLPVAAGTLTSYLVQCTTVLVAAVLMAVKARGSAGGLRRARLLISVSLLLATAGGVAVLVLRATGAAVPIPSPADALHFLFVPVCVAGLLSYPVRDDVPGSRTQLVLDGLVATTALWFVTWTAALAPAHVGAGLPPTTAATILAYPASDAFLVAVAAGALRRVAVEARREVGLAVAGLLLYVTSDVAYTVLAAQGRYTAYSWVGALAEAGLLLLVVAFVGSCSGGRLSRTWVRAAATVPWCGVAGALVFAAAAAVLGHDLGGMSLGLLVALMVALCLRQLVATRDRELVARRLRESQARLEHDARHDHLTGLGNLAHARRALEVACAAADDGTIVLLLDLDGFKQVNDSFGHSTGDALLVAVAERLRGAARPADTVCRTGGDEFLVALTATGEEAARAVAEHLLAALARPVEIGARTVVLGASIGLAPVRAGRTPDDVLRDADLAMYQAKAAGRGSAVVFQPWMHERSQRELSVTTALRRALREGGLELDYQPLVRLETGEVTGVEALLRWRPADGPPIPPDEFIGLAEAAGLMPEVDAWVLDRACADLAAWRAAGVPLARTSVNVSRRSLTPALPTTVLAALARHGLRGEDLCVEVTETSVAPDPAAAATVLLQLRAVGVRIALDDFGIGQSSLSELATLPVDVVKLDRSFLAHAGERDGDALVTSVVALCTALGLDVVAEGIEDRATAARLAAAGCAYGQGFALGRPQRPEQVVGVIVTGVGGVRGNALTVPR